MTTLEVIEAGWPAEKMRHEAATLRVYTTVRRLRGLGHRSFNFGRRLDGNITRATDAARLRGRQGGRISRGLLGQLLQEVERTARRHEDGDGEGDETEDRDLHTQALAPGAGPSPAMPLRISVSERRFSSRWKSI